MRFGRYLIDRSFFEQRFEIQVDKVNFSMETLKAPESVGIKGIEIYFPSQCLLQEELEKHDGVSTGKYTVGLGLTMMGFCDDREDIYSICLTTVSRGSYMNHVYDFYKPDLTSEYPIVDGHYSVACYIRAVDYTYRAYNKRYSAKRCFGDGGNTLVNSLPIDRFDYCIFHSPTCKSVEKAYARMLYNDFMENQNHSEFRTVKHLSNVEYESSLTDKNLEKQFINLNKERFELRVKLTLDVSTNVGNMYTASLYGCLVSLLSNVPPSKLVGKRIGAYSYGSGLTATFFSLTICGDVSYIVEKLNLKAKLANRRILSPLDFEHVYLSKEYIPRGDISNIAPNTYYLVKIDEKYRREYAVCDKKI
ncbi:hypothetical protein PCK2_000571 [Pneumocystis canis]|nr:hypothetical protein PCK2_000571 [Pneumocystis canis]